jgi:hypothetical protein
MIVYILIYTLSSICTAWFFYKKKDVDLFTSILSCIVFTPILGGIILYFLIPDRARKPQFDPFVYLKIRWISVCSGGVVLLMIALNPSYSAFKEYSGDLNTSTKKWVHNRVRNYLIYSVYERHIVYKTYTDRWMEKPETERYVGFLMNFYQQ